MSLALTKDTLEEFQKGFDKDPKNILAQNVCTKVDPRDVLASCRRVRDTVYVFNHKVDPEGKPHSDQKHSGRCWIFAFVNAARIPIMRHYQLEELEFSQTHLFFWDKVERCNFFLNSMAKIARNGDPVDGRLMSFLLHDPTSDGGQWDMLCSIVKKHGLVPKKNFGESFNSENTVRMNAILRSKLREYAKYLRQMVEKNASDEDIEKEIKGMMETCYRVVSICLGSPPSTFTWEYYTKDKTYGKVGPVTPLEFYEEHVKPHFNIDDKICLVNDPRPENPYANTYTVEYLGNVVGGQQVIYNNQPIEVLMKAVVDSIKGNEAVWFGCEVQKRFDMKRGILDLALHEYNVMFGTEINLGLSKAERLLFGESLMTHSMLFTGVSLDTDNNPVKFRVENSWGEDSVDKGYMVMTQEWFKEFVFEVVVDKKILSPDVVSTSDKEPKVLPAWDPMGALAK